MEYLARKIDPSMWGTQAGGRTHCIRADAITGPCLRTHKDELSLWQCTNNQEDVSEVVLALMSNTRLKAVEGIHLVLFELEDLFLSEIMLVCSPQNAQTVIADLHKRHVDAIQLHMGNIVNFAEKIAAKVRQNTEFYSFTRKQVLRILRDATRSERLRLDLLTSLQPNQKSEIQRGL